MMKLVVLERSLEGFERVSLIRVSQKIIRPVTEGGEASIRAGLLNSL